MYTVWNKLSNSNFAMFKSDSREDAIRFADDITLLICEKTGEVGLMAQ